MAYQLIADITLLGKSAEISLAVDDNNLGQGSLSFQDGPLDLNATLDKLVQDITAKDAGFKSPFDSIPLPKLEFMGAQLESFDSDSKGSGFVLKTQGEVAGEAFTVKYGTYAPINNGTTPQSFSLQLSPFTIDTLPGVNIHLDKPIMVDIQEIGIVTEDFIDENNNKVTAGFFIKGELSISDTQKFDLAYPAAATSPAQSNGQALLQAPEDTSNVTNTDTGMLKWFDVNKSLGPAHLKQVGIQWKDGKVWVLLNTSLSFFGITLDLIGLKAGEAIAFPPPWPTFGLNGLGLGFDEGGVDVSGSFDKIDPTLSGVTSQFDGAVEIKFEEVLIEGIGSYAKINGHDSIFVYAFLDYPIGGPAFFFVEGLALGFGYNRQLIMPPLDQVESFPLVAQALGGTTPENANDPVKMLSETLDPYIPPMEGELLLAVGIKFNSFKVLDSFLLLGVSFGKRTRFDLMGLSQLRLPPDDQNNPVVFAEIALEASLDPEAGLVQVDGLITEHSYVLSKDAHLSGGFAFYSWFKDQTDTGASAGDFVVSLGGYNPKFKQPDYYPTVPRIALNWQVNKELDIKAAAYFAMTPRYAMAGFDLKATYHSGSLGATFAMGADFLIQWKPFHYDITAYISIRASFTASIHLVFVTIHKTFHLDVGANLHLWGPAFSGHADIHVKVMGVGFSFNVSFGAGAGAPPPLTWQEFTTAFLPIAKQDQQIEALTISATEGLIKKVSSNKEEIWVLNPKDLRLQVNSLIPLTKLNVSPTIMQANGTFPHYGNAPMQISKGDFNSPLTITLTGSEDQVLAATLVSKKMPASLWGERSADVNAEALLDLVGGVELNLAKPPTPGASNKIPEENLAFDTSQSGADFWKKQDQNTNAFVYDASLFQEYLPDYSNTNFPQLTGSSTDEIVNTLETSQDLLAKPVAVALV